jgi:hypothetical protein
MISELSFCVGRGFSSDEMKEFYITTIGREIEFGITSGLRVVASNTAKLVADAKKAEIVPGWKPTISELASILDSLWGWEQKIHEFTQNKKRARAQGWHSLPVRRLRRLIASPAVLLPAVDVHLQAAETASSYL